MTAAATGSVWRTMPDGQVRLVDAPSPVKMTKHERTCRSKKRYVTRQEAKRRAKIYGQRFGHRFKVYTCPYCENYHMTTAR